MYASTHVVLAPLPLRMRTHTHAHPETGSEYRLTLVSVYMCTHTFMRIGMHIMRPLA
jgi:hypothetical protein